MASSSIKDPPTSKLVYIIKGDPIALARVRAHNGRFYDPQQQLKMIHRITLQSIHNRRPLYKGPLHMDIKFYFHIKKTNVKKHHPFDYMIFKPDIDNCLKWIFDLCSNGTLFHDDCSISIATCRKLYDVEPRTEFTITELENNYNGKTQSF